LFFLALLLAPSARAAEDKKPEKKKEPPRVIVVLLLGVTPGATNKLKIRGLNLTNVTELRFPSFKEPPAYKIRTTGKADVPKDQDAKKWGDTQLEIELSLPSNTPAGSNTFSVVSPDGISEPHVLAVVPAAALVLEREPNGGFRQAQLIAFGKTIQGVIGEAKDVDVFKFEARAGTHITAEIFAARYGSLLDAILTLYDDQAHILATSDDTDTGADAILRTNILADGAYYLSLIDAHDRGGAVCVYHLMVNSR